MANNVKVVIGANYGDEGKGSVVNYLALKEPERTLVALTNGGAQRGHTVCYRGATHVFHHFGSGSLCDADTYFTSEFIINPMTYVKERNELRELGIRSLKCMYHPDCRWTTPFDILTNQILQRERGSFDTCGQGIWETAYRWNHYENNMPFWQFADLDFFKKRDYLRQMRDEYFIPRIEKWYGIARSRLNIDLWDFMYNDTLLEHYIEDCNTFAFDCACKTSEVLRGYSTVIFEAGQGLLLDGQLPGQADFNTPSRTGLARVKDILSGAYENANIEICYVTRTYLTRHGDGPMEDERDLLGINTEDTNVTNEFQGHLREGLLDAQKLKQRIETDYGLITDKHNNYTKRLFITHVDQMENKPLIDLFGNTLVSGGKEGAFYDPKD